MVKFETTESQDSEFRHFLDAGAICLQKCRQCAALRYPARWICPECLSEDYDWQESAGRGEVECFVWYLQSFDPRFTEVPYNVALVRLTEGPRMICNVVDVAFGALQIGRSVTPVIMPGPNGYPILNFRLAT